MNAVDRDRILASIRNQTQMTPVVKKLDGGIQTAKIEKIDTSAVSKRGEEQGKVADSLGAGWMNGLTG